jgi:hypothetical protein
MPIGPAFAVLVVAGLVLAAVSVLALRAAGARPGVARRLAGPSEIKVGQLLGGDPLPERAMRVAGRIRCRDPLEMGGGERLVAFHRDVEVRVGGTWRSIDRVRETRSFELWDHDGSLTLDPAQAAEPLIVIPKVWRGDASQLEEPHASAVARLADRDGRATEARAVTRSLNVTDRLMVLAHARRDGATGMPRLEPPAGGYLITNLALDDAMRLLGGRDRRLVTAGVVGLATSAALLAIGGIGSFASAILGS